jgi:N-formylglutamate amidohydrolase
MFSENVQDCFLIHVPHSGVTIPCLNGYLVDESRLDDENHLVSDVWADSIFCIEGINRLVCPWSRIFCDVERLIIGEPMEAVGMGFFYTLCDDGTPLRDDHDGAKDIAMAYYQAHHNALETMIRKTVHNQGHCYIVDAHTFPDTPFQRDTNKDVPRPDVCLGTTQHNTPAHLLDYFKLGFESRGFSVTVNTPYSGSILPMNMEKNQYVSSIMIEINRKLDIMLMNTVFSEMMEFPGL